MESDAERIGRAAHFAELRRARAADVDWSTLKVDCPRALCQAKPGKPCVDSAGEQIYPHKARLRDAGLIPERRRRRKR